jgi:hypothetical protein
MRINQALGKVFMNLNERLKCNGINSNRKSEEKNNRRLKTKWQ